MQLTDSSDRLAVLQPAALQRHECMQLSVLEVAHASGDDGHSVLVAAVDCVLVTDAATRVCDGRNTSLHTTETHHTVTQAHSLSAARLTL